MPKDHDNYVYYNSQALEMDYCEAKDGTHAVTEDGVRYSRDEMQQLKIIGKVDPQIHLVKKVMEGTITECKRKSIF